MTEGQGRPGVFLSVAEARKVSLARPFRDLLRPAVEGYIVSDLPLIGETNTPEEKVDAYLERSQAVIVFATSDLEAGRFARPNIAEIARARSKPRLRNRICVLKQSGVTLASNTNPAYIHLDPNDPEPAFAAALEQLKAWGFDVHVPDLADDQAVHAGRRPGTPNPVAPATPPAESLTAGLERALSHVPRSQEAGSEAALMLIAVPATREALLRPSELEDPALASWLEREALYGEPPVLDRGEGTNTGVSGARLLARQSRASVAINEEGVVVLLRALARSADRNIMLRGIIEEEVLADLEADLAFVDRVLAHIDPEGRTSHVIPVVALVGAGYTAWRTRAEQAASPNSMTMNMSAGDQVVAHLLPPAQPRSAMSNQRSNLARDLMVLLRRAARKS
jgi:hypothetical protein